MQKKEKLQTDAASISWIDSFTALPVLRRLRPVTLSTITQTTPGNYGLSSAKNRLKVFLLILGGSLASCKQDSPVDPKLVPGSKSTVASVMAAQPLPGGKARFTVTAGNLDASGNSFVRIVNMTFNASAGTVAATAYQWLSDQKKGIALVNTHRCTFDGVTKENCGVYAPTGWLAGGSSNPYGSWTGTYTYNSTSEQLTITWNSGKTGTESWQVSNPTTALARVSLLSSSTAMGYTHGRGYGSNAPWTSSTPGVAFKTISEMVPFPTYSETYSRRAMAAVNEGVFTLAPEIYSFNIWKKTSTNLSVFHTPSSPNPKNSAHYWDEASDACTPSKCNANQRPGVSGIIYHIASLNTSRAIAYTNHCACLSTASDFPCYGGNLHPSALMQILDDNSNLVALVGIEAQNPVSSSYNGNYQFHLWDFNNIP